MYLALRQPWQAAPEQSAPTPAPVAEPAPAPGKKPGKRRRGHRTGDPAPATGDGLAEGAEEPGPEETAPPVVLSAAERRVIWRGEAVSLPPASHDFSREDSGRALSDDEIAGVVRAQSRGVIDCMARAAAGTDLRATLTVQLLVDGGGRVTRHRVQAPQALFDRGLSTCVAQALKGWRFPATGAPTLVTAPFELG